MLHRLKRHPLAVEAQFRHALVVTYAFPTEVLRPLLPCGLTLDTHGDFGFLAIAMVQTESLRPAGLPKWLGQSFFLVGYRIFARFQLDGQRTLRGLRILRSDTDRRLMVVAGNLLTHYQYRLARVECVQDCDELQIRVQTPHGESDLELRADLKGRPDAPSSESPFRTWNEAQRFAGPLPFTFDYEPESHSIVVIEGRREEWNPQPVNVQVVRCAFLQTQMFRGARPALANAFHVQDVAYRWERGVLSKLPGKVA